MRTAGPSMLSVCVVLAAARWASAQGYAPEEAMRKMQVPPGLVVELVAAEPLVRQPVAIEFDDRGRLWVAQYLQYPNPAGLKRAAVDRYSRTRYDRVPDPPPRGTAGHDRLTILEDRDGDGRAEAAKDFVSGLNLCSGLAFGHGGVFVLQVPYLLFYADRNADDVPDGDPQVLLTGFGMEDAHSVANSLTWGPDGWLYGCQGSTVTSHIRGIEFQQGVWRYHPLSHAFELFCEGGGNSWGLDFDAHGNLLYSTNYGGYALLHGVQGGYYWKQFGKHGALHNPYAYGYFDHVPHEGLRGGHVTVGGVVYQSDALPPEFRDKYVAADLLGHAAYWHELLPRGSTFSARHAGELLISHDTWFAPSDVTVGPDGAIYLCDWHDRRTAHPDPDADWDRSNGRIYRIRAAAAPVQPAAVPNLAALTSDRLAALIDSPNNWLARKARRVLADRRDVEQVLPLQARVMAHDGPPALAALWALNVSGGLSEPFALQSLDHANSDVRWWCVRLLGDARRVSPPLARRLAALAADDPAVQVRSQLASTAARMTPAAGLAIVEQLVLRGSDADDPYLPLLVWWAVERHALAARQQVVALFTRPEVARQPLARDAICPRLVRRYAAEASGDGYQACATLLANADGAWRNKLLAALDAGLADRSSGQGGSAGTLFANLATAPARAAEARPAGPAPNSQPFPQQLIQLAAGAWRDHPNDMTLVRLAARLGQQQAIDRAIELAGDGGADAALRAEAIGVLATVGNSRAVAPLVALVRSEAPQAVVARALDALAAFDDVQIAAALVERLPGLAPPLRSRACDVLLGRPAWAGRLLAAVDKGTIDAKEIAVDQLRLVAVHGDAQLDALVRKHWGSVKSGTPEERLAEMRRISNDLRAGRGDRSAGRVLYSKHCGTCHRLFGEGNQVGPELTHANRKNSEELLATIVNPSTVVRKEYTNYLIHTRDGRVLTGLLAEQTPGSVTVLDAKNERTVLERGTIEAIDESPVSLMPDNLLNPLRPQELRDLFSYLQGDAPGG